MIILAVLTTLVAMLMTLFVVGANGMRPARSDPRGHYVVGAAWVICAVLWIAWVYR